MVTYPRDAFNGSSTQRLKLHLQQPCWNVNNH